MLDKLLRYGHVARLLGPDPQGGILDVGSGPHGLGACLPYRFVGIDPWYPEPPVPTQQPVRGLGSALPFRDQSFEYVVCIETLEHVPPDIRAQVMAEMLRVGRTKIIITHPCGKMARVSDHLHKIFYDILATLFRKKRPWWLTEHLQHPLPVPARYLDGLTAGWTVALDQGRENVFLHILLVPISNLRILARLLEKAYARWPRPIERMVMWFDFPPYYGRMVVLERNRT